MNPIYEKLEKCYQCVREKTDFVPEVAIILGSGFGQFADEFEEVKKSATMRSKDFRFRPFRDTRENFFLVICRMCRWY